MALVPRTVMNVKTSQEVEGVFEYFYRLNQYRMLLLGETGSGKTSFLNFLYNSKLIEELGTSSEDPSILEKITAYNDLKIESSTYRAMVSKTSDAKVYHTEVCKMKIAVIDTPGFGDSRGLQQDKINVAQIIEMLKREDYINCVCLVINGRSARRMSASLKYILSEISSILPREVFNNIIVVFTNCAGPLDCNFDMRELVTYFGNTDDRDFYIENPYCQIEKAKQKYHLSNEKIFKSLQKLFVETAECLHSIHQCIAKFEKVRTRLFIDLYEKRQAIERDVIKLQSASHEQDEIVKQLEAAEDEVRVAKTAKMKLSPEDFKIIKVWKPVQMPNRQGNTLCGYPGCYSNCHMFCCDITRSFDQENFKRCVAFGGSETCKKCSHSYKVHYHDEVYFKQVEEKQEFVDETKFLKAATRIEERAQSLYDSVKAQQKMLLQKRSELARQLKIKISEFENLGISQINYVKLLKQQCDVLKLRIESTIGSEVVQFEDLKFDIEKQLTVVYEAI